MITTLINRVGKKNFILLISGLLALGMFFVLQAVCSAKANALTDQWEGKRWSADGDAAQISCFFSVDAQVQADTLKMIGRQLTSLLEQESLIEVTEGESSARVYADAFSETGTLTVSGAKGTVTLSALGVYGDFFLFHPVEMLSGTYFSSGDINQDSIIIDETAAWQLFGSTDIAGQVITVNEHPIIIRGVFKRPEGKLAEAAGCKDNMCFVSYQILEELGISYGINSYDIVMPNPVKGYAAEKITSILNMDSVYVQLIDTQSRFAFVNRFKHLSELSTRSMNGKAIIYPYWENLARHMEDVIAKINLIAYLFLFYFIVLYLVLFLIYWYTKGWTVNEKLLLAKDKMEVEINKIKDKHKKSESMNWDE